MNERVFADEFQKGFLQEDDFLSFLAKREENSQWETVKSKELRFYPIADGQRIASQLEEELKEQGIISEYYIFSSTLWKMPYFLR